MKAIIFGITGQDGSYLAELLLEQGYEVLGVTRRVSVDTLVRINHILPQIQIIEGDITDAFNVSNIVNQHEPDEIYNLAAQSHVGTSFNQPSLTWDVTAGGCMNSSTRQRTRRSTSMRLDPEGSRTWPRTISSAARSRRLTLHHRRRSIRRSRRALCRRSTTKAAMGTICSLQGRRYPTCSTICL